VTVENEQKIDAQTAEYIMATLLLCAQDLLQVHDNVKANQVDEN